MVNSRKVITEIDQQGDSAFGLLLSGNSVEVQDQRTEENLFVYAKRFRCAVFAAEGKKYYLPLSIVT